jgi:hypothetical protein
MVNKWRTYEQTKRKLQEMRLPPREYERLLRQLAKRLGI